MTCACVETWHPQPRQCLKTNTKLTWSCTQSNNSGVCAQATEFGDKPSETGWNDDVDNDDESDDDYEPCIDEEVVDGVANVSIDDSDCDDDDDVSDPDTSTDCGAL